MTGPEHYREAERLIATLDHGDHGDGSPIVRADDTAAILLAQVHATLADAAATAANIRRNGQLNRSNVDTDTAAGWPELLL